MESRDLKKILTQIDELRALFIFAQRVVPYLEELILFVQETTPLLEEVNLSIQESSRKMPVAVQHLDRISETTEMATTGILDGIDRILETLEEAVALVKSMREHESGRLEKEKELIVRLAEQLDGTEETRAAGVDKELSAMLSSNRSLTDLERLESYLSAVQAETYDIMNALQVQDITTQQIMAANMLIESVQKRLGQLLTKFGSIQEHNFTIRERIFDPDARYEDRSSVQEMADLIMSGAEQVDDPVVVEVTDQDLKRQIDSPIDAASTENLPATQEEIDRLFDELNR